MATNEEFERTWGSLCAAYPAWASSIAVEAFDPTLAVYERLLADLPGPLLDAAAAQHAATSPFFPTVAELRNLARELGSLNGEGPLTGMAAWGQVCNEMRRFGHYRRPQFDDPLTAQVVEQMGWQHLCMSENGMADRAHFIAAYEILARREAFRQSLLPEVRATLMLKAPAGDE